MRISLSLLLAALTCTPGALAAEEAVPWEAVRIGEGQAAVRVVAVQPAPPFRLAAATDQLLYESTDGGSTWAEQFRVPTGVEITALTGSPAEPPTWLVGTTRGLYRAAAGERRWSKVFRGRTIEEAACVQVAVHPGRPGQAVLATRGGLFLSTDDGRHWQAVPLPRAAREIRHIAWDPGHPDQLYLVTSAALFKGRLSSGQWQRCTSALGLSPPQEAADDPSEADQALETDEPVLASGHLTAVAVDPQHPSTVYLAGSDGLWGSHDGGTHWQRVTDQGLVSLSISRLLLQRRSPLLLYAATTRGIVRLDQAQHQWTAQTWGLASAAVHDLAASPSHLWAATAHGLYRAALPAAEFPEPAPPSPHELLDNFSHEPTMAQVREAAIRYAEVHPSKIKRWRRQAALQAFLPSVDVGWDRQHSRDLSVDEGTFPKFQLVETEDRDAGFDLSVNWDLGRLVWNDDQTNIDVRSKLMVQLRNDIVDEVTRTYFERRRLQVRLLSTPPTDPQQLLEQELRVQELTALIDGLTGGMFSAKTEPYHNQREGTDGDTGF